MLSKIADLSDISDALKELAPLKTAFPTDINFATGYDNFCHFDSTKM